MMTSLEDLAAQNKVACTHLLEVAIYLKYAHVLNVLLAAIRLHTSVGCIDSKRHCILSENITI